ncbi:MAG TPA: hypothetical protein VIF02_15090 [Methylocella sp.]|jgi:hypothetical protein
MKAGFTRLARKITRIEAKLADGDDMQFVIPKHSGMLGRVDEFSGADIFGIPALNLA